MTTNEMLRLDRLTLHNFRCFEECTIDLHPNLTVLVAENGGGKTALLDGMKIALGLFVDFVSATPQSVGLENTDIRRVYEKNGEMRQAALASYHVNAYILDQEISWRSTRKRSARRPRSVSKDTMQLYRVIENLREHLQGNNQDSTILPFVAFYGTNRFRLEYKKGKQNHEYDRINRTESYTGCLSFSVSLNELVNWYEIRMKNTGNAVYSMTLSYLLPLISGVEKAMQVVLAPTGWDAIKWDFNQKLLFVEHSEHGLLLPSMLSDGVRTMIGLIMDVARRCFMLNPHFGEEAALKTPGVLVIDEVDLHLHPGWQQLVIELLRQAFPNMQLILSTHSPQVLSTVNKESIRIIRLQDGRGWTEIPQFQTRGVESADILARVMGVDLIPRVEQAQWLRDYHALIQEYMFDTDEAQILRKQLENHFGSQHPLILECDRLINLERFKRTLSKRPIQKRD